MAVYEVSDRLYITFQGVVKSSGEPFVVLGGEVAIPVVQRDDGIFKVDESSQEFMKLSEFLAQYKEEKEEEEESLQNVFILGYYNSADGVFYQDPDFSTSLVPNAVYLYIDGTTGYLYRYSGSAYIQVAGVQIPQADWNETDPESDSYIKNKPTALSAFTNDEGFISQAEVTAILSDYLTEEAISQIYATIEYVNARVASVYRNKGSVATVADLESIETKVDGDVYNVIENGKNYVWVENLNNTGVGGWDELGGIVDLTPLTNRIAALETFQKTIPVPTVEDSGKVMSVDSTGHFTLKSEYSYTLPKANSTTLGGVQPSNKTAEQSQEVGVDADGKLWTLPNPDLSGITGNISQIQTNLAEVATNAAGAFSKANEVAAGLLLKQNILTPGDGISIIGNTISADIQTYTLPKANSTTLGGVMPSDKVVEMTQEVGVDENGKLWTYKSESGGDPEAFAKANAAYNQANLAFDKANLAAGDASAAYTAVNALELRVNGIGENANNAGILVQNAFNQANSAYTQANGAFNKVNSVASSVETLDAAVNALNTSVININNSLQTITENIETIQNDITEINGTLATKQNILTAGNNIQINGSTISSTIPLATSETIGGVKPIAKLENMGQQVGVDANGQLWTFTSESGGDPAAYAQANAAYNQANLAFNKANDAYTLASTANTLLGDKQNILTPGEGISIVGNTISSTIDQYTLPLANATTLGGVKPVEKTTAMATQVGVDANGQLWAAVDASISSSLSALQEKVGQIETNVGVIDSDLTGLSDQVDEQATTISSLETELEKVNSTAQTANAVAHEAEAGLVVVNSVLVNKQNKLTAGNYIEINGNTISANVPQYSLPTASTTVLGGIKASGTFDSNNTASYSEIVVDSNSIAWAVAPSVPMANATTAGLVKPVGKTSDMNTPVGVDENGQLWVKEITEGETDPGKEFPSGYSFNRAATDDGFDTMYAELANGAVQSVALNASITNVLKVYFTYNHIELSNGGDFTGVVPLSLSFDGNTTYGMSLLTGPASTIAL